MSHMVTIIYHWNNCMKAFICSERKYKLNMIFDYNSQLEDINNSLNLNLNYLRLLAINISRMSCQSL
jgi:hypothetical protein